MKVEFGAVEHGQAPVAEQFPPPGGQRAVLEDEDMDVLVPGQFLGDQGADARRAGPRGFVQNQGDRRGSLPIHDFVAHVANKGRDGSFDAMRDLAVDVEIDALVAAIFPFLVFHNGMQALHNVAAKQKHEAAEVVKLTIAPR